MQRQSINHIVEMPCDTAQMHALFMMKQEVGNSYAISVVFRPFSEVRHSFSACKYIKTDPKSRHVSGLVSVWAVFPTQPANQ